MNARIRTFVLGALVAAALPLVAATARQSDPVIGGWTLNVAKSTYGMGKAPKSGTRTYTAVANGYTLVSKGIDADGKPTSSEFTAKFDGKFYAVTGRTTVDSIMLKRIDANHTESTQTKGGKVVVRTTREVSKDGKTLTSTTKGTDAAGKPYTNVEVFDRK